MALIVIDASALASICFVEPDWERVADAISGAQLASPALLDFELANIAWKKIRRDPARASLIMTGLAARNEFAIKRATVDHDAACALALQTSLSAYDASYLWLAEQAGAGLVTLDEKLARVARSRRA